MNQTVKEDEAREGGWYYWSLVDNLRSSLFSIRALFSLSFSLCVFIYFVLTHFETLIFHKTRLLLDSPP